MNPATLEQPARAEATPTAAERPAPQKRQKRPLKVSCADCWFFQNDLCALDHSEPCATFRPADEGLQAPQQLSFVFRQERTRAAWVFQRPR